MAKKPTDDLFEKSTMTFGEHLEELRVCLFRGVIGIVAWLHDRLFRCQLGRAVFPKSAGAGDGAVLRRARPSMISTKGATLAIVILSKSSGRSSTKALIPEPIQIEPAAHRQRLRLSYPRAVRRPGNFGLLVHARRFSWRRRSRAALPRSGGGERSRWHAAGGECWQLLDDDQRKFVTDTGRRPAAT